LRSGKHNLKSLAETSYQGMAELLPVVSIILLAFALGTSMQALGTGPFIAGMISQTLPPWLIAPVIFITAGLISFTTGTSWGTFGILIPVAIPIALATGLPPALLLAAVLGGGVFGDHCSPISDSTVLASLAAGCEHLEHVRTQLPYALLAAGLSVPFFILFSL
jgi:tetracycline resistance efflux pump